tara:strand:+ start:342 stop:797 length:456 start_codon:yes stop_codon:yes gene_type:complete
MEIEDEYHKYLDIFYQELDNLNEERIQKKNISLIPPNLDYTDNRRKTRISNIIDICKKINREPEHFISFLVRELQIQQDKCHINTENQLIISQYLKLDRFKNLMKNYCQIFIKCKKCRSTNTIIKRDENMKKDFLYCNFCHGKEYLLYKYR